MKTVYYIKEANGKYNFSLCYNKTKILSSHGQGYSRLTDCKRSFKNNCKSAKEVITTRKEFVKITTR